ARPQGLRHPGAPLPRHPRGARAARGRAVREPAHVGAPRRGPRRHLVLAVDGARPAAAGADRRPGPGRARRDPPRLPGPRQPQEGGDAGRRLPHARERCLPLRPDAGARCAVRRRARHPPRRLRRRLRLRHSHLPHRPRVRSHRHVGARGAQGLMLLALLVALPALAGLAAFFIDSVAVCLGILVTVAAVHAGLVAGAWLGVAAPLPLLGLDVPAPLSPSITAGLSLVASISPIPYVPGAVHDRHASARQFVPCLLWFLAAMSLVTVSRHLALLWAAVEATTL